MPVEASLLSQIQIFRDLPATALGLVASRAHLKRFPPLQLVLGHHTTPAFLILVLRGQLQKTELSEDGRITGVDYVNPGQVLDWLSIIDGGPVIFSVTTTCEADLLLLPIADARDLLKTYNVIGQHVQLQLVQDVRRITEQRQLLTLPNAYQRVFVQIIQLAEQAQDQKSTNLPKQHEIAAMVNTSRETVSRAIQMLVKNGILIKNGHRFLVQGTERLRRLAAMSDGATDANKAEKA